MDRLEYLEEQVQWWDGMLDRYHEMFADWITEYESEIARFIDAGEAAVRQRELWVEELAFIVRMYRLAVRRRDAQARREQVGA